LEENKIDLIVLAGFMRLLSPEFVSRFKFRILTYRGSKCATDIAEYATDIAILLFFAVLGTQTGCMRD